MKRFCFLVVLTVLSSSAGAGSSISFTVRGHRVHIEAPRHCRSTSCASVSISGMSRSIHGRDDDRNVTGPGRSLPPSSAPAAASPLAPPVNDTSATAAAPPPAVYRPAASTTQTVDVPPAPPPVQPVSIPLPPPPAPVVEQAEAASVTPPQVSRVSRDVEEEPADTPLGDWQTEGKGMLVRIAKCGEALCGYVLDPSSNDKGEAVLINMKPKTNQQWIGSVYSQSSGDTYYGTIRMRGSNTLRVEACALGRFYCSGNNWSRISGRAESLMSSRQAFAEPRS